MTSWDSGVLTSLGPRELHGDVPPPSPGSPSPAEWSPPPVRRPRLSDVADPAVPSSNQGPWTARERMAGARAALEGAGIDHPDLLLSGIDDPEQAQLQTRRLLGVTVLRQDPALLGRTSVELARSRMSTPGAARRAAGPPGMPG